MRKIWKESHASGHVIFLINAKAEEQLNKTHKVVLLVTLGISSQRWWGSHLFNLHFEFGRRSCVFTGLLV